MDFNAAGAGGQTPTGNSEISDEKKLEEEFFKFLMESELMEDIQGEEDED